MVGHADSIGRGRSNEQLAAKRASSIHLLLLAHNVPDSLIQVRSSGALVPIAENITATGRSRNRRVYVSIESRIENLAVQVTTTPVDTCTGDTVLTLVNGWQGRFNKCVYHCCLIGVYEMALDDLIRFKLRTITPKGIAFSVCAMYHSRFSLACDPELLQNPMTLTIPTASGTLNKEEAVVLYDNEGQWVDARLARMKIKLIKNSGRSFVRINSPRMMDIFSFCSTKRSNDPRMRVRVKDGTIPDSVAIYSSGPDLFAIQLIHKRRRVWVGRVPLQDRYVVEVSTPMAIHMYADLSKRRRRRTYILQQTDLSSAIPKTE